MIPLPIDPESLRRCPKCSCWVGIDEATANTVLLTCGHYIPASEWETAPRRSNPTIQDLVEVDHG